MYGTSVELEVQLLTDFTEIFIGSFWSTCLWISWNAKISTWLSPFFQSPDSSPVALRMPSSNSLWYLSYVVQNTTVLPALNEDIGCDTLSIKHAYSSWLDKNCDLQFSFLEHMVRDKHWRDGLLILFENAVLKFDWGWSHKRLERRISVPHLENSRNRIWVKISNAKTQGYTCRNLHYLHYIDLH